MIEPHSAQDGASSWTVNATDVVPRDAESTALPFPEPLPLQPAGAFPVDPPTGVAFDSVTVVELAVATPADVIGPTRHPRSSPGAPSPSVAT
jgi:hypothetical protein